ncbi:DUF3322 domain-containing protein [Polaromonas sp.]|uniref:DUF3322 domain-containing protein n=1 Tax=Polaromonas sp. TaxID=1869339 RepID=UPI003563D2DC
MSWTSPADLRAQIQKLWDRGELLASLVTGKSLFPLRLAIKTPTSREMADSFDAVRVWVGELRSMPCCRVTMREFRHRVFGTNSVPHELWVDSLDDALVLVGKRRDAAHFAALVLATREREPKLLAWLARRPLRALELSNDWHRLLEIISWMRAHPRPGIYIRQVDIPGVHTKFIEAYRGVLSELLDLVLPPETVDPAATGASQFAQRYGFRKKPLRIRFRILDAKHALGITSPEQDITLDALSFARLEVSVSRVFITENEVNFLAFPTVKDALVIFGAGYGFEMLAQTSWLTRCRIYYWGDIDTHGFAILDQLRAHFGHVDSFLMDRATLMAFESQWGEDEMRTQRDLPRLTADELALYDDLRDNRLRPRLRLEQERIGFTWVQAALSKLAH